MKQKKKSHRLSDKKIIIIAVLATCVVVLSLLIYIFIHANTSVDKDRKKFSKAETAIQNLRSDLVASSSVFSTLSPVKGSCRYYAQGAGSGERCKVGVSMRLSSETKATFDTLNAVLERTLQDSKGFSIKGAKKVYTESPGITYVSEYGLEPKGIIGISCTQKNYYIEASGGGVAEERSLSFSLSCYSDVEKSVYGLQH